MKMALRLFSICLLLLSSVSTFGQTVLFADDFEGANSWSAIGPTINTWTIEQCAGNGNTSAGLNSMYVTNGAPDGCSASGNEAFAYSNAASGIEEAVVATLVDASCASNYQLYFDYIIEGVSTEDFVEVVYSLDGVNFTAVGAALPQTPFWNFTTISLPALLDFSSFWIGFRFTYNDANLGSIPAAIDNIALFGDDTVPPSITCPTSLELLVNSSCQAICEDMTKDMIALSDNCIDSALIVVTQDVPQFTIFPGGAGTSETITLTATDLDGNSSQCSFTLFIIDEEPPSILCPADTNVYVNGNCDGILENYTGDAIVTDNCSPIGSITVTQNPPQGLIINGTIVEQIVELTATDENGNFASCTFTARTIDSIPATITCPSDTVVYSDLTCTGTLGDYTGGAIASDNCVPSGMLSITQDPPATSIITGDQVITMYVNGGIPNTAQSCSFTAFFVDTIAPAIICPAPMAIYASVSCEGLVPDYASMAGSSENCDPFPTITQNPLPGTTLSGLGATLITLTIQDNSGNTSSCQISQMLIDTIKPVINCPLDQTLNADASCMAILPDYTSLVSATDNCSPTVTITQNIVSGTSIFTTTTLTMTAEDGSGNTQNCAFNVALNDNIAPTIICPADITVNADASCTYTVPDFASSATGADNCSASNAMTYTQAPTAGSTIGSGANLITLTVEDENANVGSCQFTIQVNDNSAPSISSCGPNQTVYSDASCQATIGDYTGNLTVSDNCSSVGNLTISQNPIAGTTVTASTNVIFTVLDESGNSTTCPITLIVLDTVAPAITCPAPQSISINSSCEYSMPDLTSAISGSDNCSAFGAMTVSQNPVSGSMQNGITNVLLTLTDENGNSASCFALITPIDTDAPTITCPNPMPVNNGASCDFVLPNYASISTVLDNCADYTITQLPAVGTTVQTGSTTISLEVTDAGGNTANCSFVLVVLENESPVITCPTNISTCDPMVTYAAPSFSDNCLVSMSQTDLTGLTSGMSFPIGTTTLEYTAVDSSGNLQSCQFNVQILDYPSQANITEDSIYLCAQNGTVLNADPAVSGTGEWTVLSGQGSFNNQFANTTGVNNIGIGTNAYIWTITTASCGSTADTVIVLNAQQDLQASTQDTIYGCNQASIPLMSNAPLYGTGTWTTSGSGNIESINSPNTTSTFENGWQEFIWTISNPGCPSTSDTLHVFGLLAPTIVQADTLVCLENDAITISASGLSGDQSGSWSVISGEATIANNLLATTTASDFLYGTTLLVYTISHPSCPSRADTLAVSGNLCNGFDPQIPTVFTPGNLDGSNDLFTIPFLDIVYPDCKVLIFNRWGSVVFESIGYTEAWDGTFKGEPLPTGTYFYQIDLNDGSGQQYKGDISIIR